MSDMMTILILFLLKGFGNVEILVLDFLSHIISSILKILKGYHD